MANYSIYSIPLYWLIALWPHVHAVSSVRSAHNGKWDNANPRGQAVVDKYVKTTSPEIQARYERAKAAHNNLLENAPLFIGAIVIGNFVGLPTSTLNTAAGAYLGLRVLYAQLYINTTTRKVSFLRSLVWAISTGILFFVYVKAGNKALHEG